MELKICNKLEEGLEELVKGINQNLQKGKLRLKADKSVDKSAPIIGGAWGYTTFIIKYKRNWYSQASETKIVCWSGSGNELGYRPSSNFEYEKNIEQYLHRIAQEYSLRIVGIREWPCQI